MPTTRRSVDGPGSDDQRSVSERRLCNGRTLSREAVIPGEERRASNECNNVRGRRLAGDPSASESSTVWATAQGQPAARQIRSSDGGKNVKKPLNGKNNRTVDSWKTTQSVVRENRLPASARRLALPQLARCRQRRDSRGCYSSPAHPSVCCSVILCLAVCSRRLYFVTATIGFALLYVYFSRASPLRLPVLSLYSASPRCRRCTAVLLLCLGGDDDRPACCRSVAFCPPRWSTHPLPAPSETWLPVHGRARFRQTMPQLMVLHLEVRRKRCALRPTTSSSCSTGRCASSPPPRRERCLPSWLA